MSSRDGLDYGYLVQKAMRGMMSDVLSRVADSGLPGDHHFYISFETDHPGVDIPEWLHDTYPSEMTIVLQDWFRDLAVAQDRFSVTLNFSDQAETLVVPFDAVRTFVDPSVKFGLKFDPQEPGEDIEFDLPDEAEAEIDQDDRREAEIAESSPKGGQGADVVSLDKFRKT